MQGEPGSPPGPKGRGGRYAGQPFSLVRRADLASVADAKHRGSYPLTDTRTAVGPALCPIPDLPHSVLDSPITCLLPVLVRSKEVLHDGVRDLVVVRLVVLLPGLAQRPGAQEGGQVVWHARVDCVTVAARSHAVVDVARRQRLQVGVFCGREPTAKVFKVPCACQRRCCDCARAVQLHEYRRGAAAWRNTHPRRVSFPERRRGVKAGLPPAEDVCAINTRVEGALAALAGRLWGAEARFSNTVTV